MGETKGREEKAKAGGKRGDPSGGVPGGAQVVKKSAAREWTESLLIAFVLAMFIRAFFIQAYKIPSGSMRPTLIEGDRLMVNKVTYGPRFTFRFKEKILLSFKRLPGLGKMERGDIIVFIYPEDPSRDFIKRLVAFGGETVEIRDGGIYINDEMVRDSEVANVVYYNRGTFGEEGQKVKVPDGHVFVLGDNSGSSHDSRYWGFVPVENVIGKAQFIYWPVDRMRMIR